MQKYVYLNHDFEVNREVEKDAPPDCELTMHWMRSAIIAGYPNMKSDQRRMYASIDKKMNIAKKENSEWLPLNQFEIIFMKSAFDMAQIKAEYAPYITTAENALLNATDVIPENKPIGNANVNADPAPNKA